MLVEPSGSIPGLIKRLPWSHMEDYLHYDLLTDVGRITCPTLLMVGSDDTSTPPEDQRVLYEALTCEKELHIIPHADHNFAGAGCMEVVREIFDGWVERLGGG